jgi:hypothetical protein
MFHTLLAENTKTHKNCEARYIYYIKVFLRKIAMLYERQYIYIYIYTHSRWLLTKFLLKGLIRHTGPINFQICEDEKSLIPCQKQIWIYQIFLYVKCFSNIIFSVITNVRTFLYTWIEATVSKLHVFPF